MAKYYICIECNEQFTSKDTIIEHMKTLHKSSKQHCSDDKSPRYQCKYCEHRFVAEHHLETHIKCHHEQPIFASTQGSNSHKLNHNEDSKIQIKQEIFNEEGNLKKFKPTKEYCPDNDHPRFVEEDKMKIKEEILDEDNNLTPDNLIANEAEIINDDIKVEPTVISFKTEEDNHNVDSVNIDIGDEIYSCDVCKKIFTETQSLKLHMWGHKEHVMKSSKCHICHKMFDRHNYMKYHLRVHTGEKPYKCETCGKKFAHDSNYKVHLKFHIEAGELPIDYLKAHNLNQNEDSKIQRKQVILNEEENLRNNQPSTKYTPGDKISNFLNLNHEEHNQVKIEEEVSDEEDNLTLDKFKTKTADNFFDDDAITVGTSVISSKTDMEDKTNVNNVKVSKGDKKYSCDVCKKNFTKSCSLKSHTSCNICHKKFKECYYLKKHIRIIHKGEKPFKCEICGEKFAYNSNYRVHLRVHTGEKPYSCDICHKKFPSNSDLKKHNIKIHITKLYKCNTCPEKFNLSDNLKAHAEVCPGKKTHSCDKCHKKFTRLHNFNLHMKIHTGEELYCCDKCNKKFVLKSHLKSHKRYRCAFIHSFSCEQCNIKFDKSVDLKLHMRVHSEIKLYDCDMCDKKFAWSSNLEKHMKTHVTWQSGA